MRDAVARAEHMRHSAYAAIEPQLQKAIKTGEALANKKAELAKDPRLSDVGRTEQLREIAALHAPTLGKAARALDKARAANQKKLAALAPVIEDPDNVAKAIVKMEIRSVMRSKTPAEVMALASAENAHRWVIESIIEAPQLLHGLPAEHVEQLRKAVVERTRGPELPMPRSILDRQYKSIIATRPQQNYQDYPVKSNVYSALIC